jgi:hypothetical protein
MTNIPAVSEMQKCASDEALKLLLDDIDPKVKEKDRESLSSLLLFLLFLILSFLLPKGLSLSIDLSSLSYLLFLSLLFSPLSYLLFLYLLGLPSLTLGHSE